MAGVIDPRGVHTSKMATADYAALASKGIARSGTRRDGGSECSIKRAS